MTDPERVEILTSVPSEAEAVLIIAALRDAGIKALDEGALTSGMRAEVPGEVDVLVRGEDLERAQSVLAEFRKGGDDVDWSQVDVGDPEE